MTRQLGSSTVSAPTASIVRSRKPAAKRRKALDVGEVARQAERHADRAGALAAALLHQLEEARQRQVRALWPARRACRPRSDPFRRFARAGIAEAAGPQRDAFLRRRAPRPGGSRAAGRSDRRSSSSRSRRDPRRSTARTSARPGGRCRGGAPGARSAASRSGSRSASGSCRCRRARGGAARSPPPGCSGSSACRPRTRPRAAPARGRRPCTVAKFTVPPANHGRRSVASAALRISRQPTPVG